jgi:hypothetical protein
MRKLLLVALLIVPGAGLISLSLQELSAHRAAAAEAKKKTWYYVCEHDGCKQKGETHRYEEASPVEHKCPACKNRMTLKYDN